MPPITIVAADGPPPCILTFARSHDAQLFAVRTHLSSSETAQLRGTLDQLVAIGALALYRIETLVEDTVGWPDVVSRLRHWVGPLPVEAAAGATRYPSTCTPKPQTLIPVWRFERLSEGADVLVACGLFSGMPIIFEALPVADDDLAEPLPSVADCFRAWRAAVRRRAMLGTVALADWDGAYAVFGSVQAG